MYKLSYYTIISAPVDAANRRVAYSTRSGQSLLLPDICYRIIRDGLTAHIPAPIREKLVALQILVPEEENELHNIISENHEYNTAGEPILKEVIQPTAMCQLGCYYCGQQHKNKYLSEDLIEKLTTRIYHKFSTGNYSGIHIGWFGGEPLMGLPQMRAIYKALKEKTGNDQIKIGGMIVTNGLSLKEPVFEELVREFHVNRIEITLDGTAEYHDSHRYTKKGTASFDIIYRNLKTILKRADFESLGCNITIRCNVDYRNKDGVVPLIEQLAADGLHKKIGMLYFKSIYSWGGNDAHKQSLSREEFAFLELKWDILKIRLGYPYDTRFYERRKNTCIATGGPSELYDAYGNIYNCTEISYTDFYEGSAYKLGTLEKNGTSTFENKPHNDWFDIVRDTERFPCHHCRLLPVCGGSCPKSWTEGNPACPSFKYNILKYLELKHLLLSTPAGRLEEKLISFEQSLQLEDFKRFN